MTLPYGVLQIEIYYGGPSVRLYPIYHHGQPELDRIFPPFHKFAIIPTSPGAWLIF